MEMDSIVKFLKGFSVQMIIEIAVVVWLLMMPIRSDIAKHAQQIEATNKSIAATNQRLDSLYCTIIKMLEDKNK